MKSILSCFILAVFCLVGCNQPKAKVSTVDMSQKADFGKLNENAPPETVQYGRLTGEWECLITGYRNDSIVSQSTANWVFKYALDGYAIQDFWKNPAKLDSTNQQQIFGTNIRIYNPQLGLWQCAWMENQASSISGIWLSRVNEQDEILLYDESETWQIKFFNISDAAFDWKWDVQQPDGEMKTNVTIKAKKIRP